VDVFNKVPDRLKDSPVVPVAYGSGDDQRLYWEEIVQAGANRKLMDLVLPDYDDVVVQYQLEANSTETCEIRFAQHSTRGTVPIDVHCGPNGGGRIRLAGAVRINIQVSNEVAGSARIRIWVYPHGFIGTVPPIQSFGVTLPAGVGGTPGIWVAVSPGTPMTGWCPWGRTRVSIGSSIPIDVSFQNQINRISWQGCFDPTICNSQLEVVHPPLLRLFMRNQGSAPIARAVATWED
jgi:hypothetical protein